MKDQKEQKEEEESLLKAHHQSQQERLKNQCDEEAKNLISAFEAAKADMKQKHHEWITKHETEYWISMYENLRSQNKAYREMVTSRQDLNLNIGRNCYSEHQKLLESFKEEFNLLKFDQLPQINGDDFHLALDSYSQYLMSVEARRLDVLKVVHEEDLIDLEELHANEEKNLKDKASPGIFSK